MRYGYESWRAVRIEHRMFCHVTQNWRGKPFARHEVIVNLIAATTTKAGLSIRSDIDDNEHATDIKVSDDQMEALSIRRAGFPGEWNYTLLPRTRMANLFWRVS